MNRAKLVADEKNVKAFFLEAKLLASLRHPHIIGFLWGYMSGPFLIAMELCENGSLGDRIRGKIRLLHSPPFSMAVAVTYAYVTLLMV